MKSNLREPFWFSLTLFTIPLIASILLCSLVCSLAILVGRSSLKDMLIGSAFAISMGGLGIVLTIWEYFFSPDILLWRWEKTLEEIKRKETDQAKQKE